MCIRDRYCKYGISYRELQEMLAERGVNVDHSTICLLYTSDPELENFAAFAKLLQKRLQHEAPETVYYPPRGSISN